MPNPDHSRFCGKTLKLRNLRERVISVRPQSRWNHHPELEMAYEDRHQDSEWEVCCQPGTENVATLRNVGNNVSLVLGDKDFITVSECLNVDQSVGKDQWRVLVNGQSASIQLELLTAPNRYIASAFTARLTQPIDDRNWAYRNTFLKAELIGEAKCADTLVRF